MGSVSYVRPVVCAGGETDSRVSGSEEITSMPPRTPALMVAREIVIWTPVGLLEMALSHVLGVFLSRRQQPGRQTMPQIDLVE